MENIIDVEDFRGLQFSLIGDSISTYDGVSNTKTYNPLYLSTSEATFGSYITNTLVGGSYSSDGSFTDAYYSLARPITLKHDQPWAFEFKGGARGIFGACQKTCHCEPFRRMVWQSPKFSGLLMGDFPSKPGDSHASVRTGSE